jgi:hypothetical protein
VPAAFGWAWRVGLDGLLTDLAPRVPRRISDSSGNPLGSCPWTDSLLPPPVLVTMTIPGDVTAITSDATIQAEFELAFEIDIALALGISATRVNVTSIAAGSIVVSYTIAPDPTDGRQLSESAITTILASSITLNTIQSSSVIPSSVTATYTNAVSATVTVGNDGTVTDGKMGGSGASHCKVPWELIVALLCSILAR